METGKRHDISSRKTLKMRIGMTGYMKTRKRVMALAVNRRPSNWSFRKQDEMENRNRKTDSVIRKTIFSFQLILPWSTCDVLFSYSQRLVSQNLCSNLYDKPIIYYRRIKIERWHLILICNGAYQHSQLVFWCKRWVQKWDISEGWKRTLVKTNTKFAQGQW